MCKIAFKNSTLYRRTLLTLIIKQLRLNFADGSTTEDLNKNVAQLALIVYY